MSALGSAIVFVVIGLSAFCWIVHEFKDNNDDE